MNIPAPASFATVSDLQDFLALREGGTPFSFARDNPRTLEVAEKHGVRRQAEAVIGASRELQPTIEASVERARRTLRIERVAKPADAAPPAYEFPTEASAKPTLAPKLADEAASRKVAPILWPALVGLDPPAREWAIDYWLGLGHVSLLVGQGGIGKTLLAQQMGSSLALGRHFVDTIARPRRVLMWACEDDLSELWRRQVDIARWMGETDLGAFDAFHLVPRHGLDNALAKTDLGRLGYTPLLQELRDQVHDLRAEVVILDNIAQLYGGNENDRHQVTTFMNALSGALPGRAIVLLAHPSRGEGSEFSGSSAWENVARTRLYLGDRLPDQKRDPEEEPDHSVRYLARRKANYSSKDWRRLQFRDGVLLPDPVESGEGGIVGEIRERNAENIVLDGLRRLAALGIRATEGKSSPAYLPRVLIEHKINSGRPGSELAAAMRRLRVAGTIATAQIGCYPNRTAKHGLVISSDHSHK